MSAASRKSAERQRRKDAGELRVETWLEPHLIAMLDRFCAPGHYTRAEGLRCMIWNIDSLQSPPTKAEDR